MTIDHADDTYSPVARLNVTSVVGVHGRFMLANYNVTYLSMLAVLLTKGLYDVTLKRWC